MEAFSELEVALQKYKKKDQNASEFHNIAP